MKRRPFPRRLAVGLLLLGTMLPCARAQSLPADFSRALSFDATYAAAVAANDGDKLQARMAGMAYYPEGRISSTQLDNESSSRLTFGITQPLISYDRWLMLKEEDPRLAAAAARLEQSQQELAQRLFSAVSSLADARERLRLNEAAFQSLEIQVQSARRSFELGQGTITDVRDTDVRLAQVRSETFSLRASLSAAERQYASVMGDSPVAGVYTLTTELPALDVPPLDEFLQRARTLNPGIRASQQAVTLAEIAVKRARASLFPTLAAVAQQSRIHGGQTNSSSTISLRMEIPLQAGSYFKSDVAALELLQAQARERDAMRKLTLDIERLHTQLLAVLGEVKVRREAIQAAKLSLEANEQSFKGGFRTRVDVLNAIKAKFQAEADHVSAMLRLGDTLLALQLASAVEVNLALRQVQQQVFSR